MNKYILTHPLSGNYGGMLQAYASYTILNKKLGNAAIYRYTPKNMQLNFKKNWYYFKQHVKHCLGKSDNANTTWRNLEVAHHFSKCINFHDEEHQIHESDNVAFVVGSDQVWRAEYCREMKDLPFFFLNFLTKEQRKNSIAYSASFGTDEWEGTEAETEACRELLNDFKAVSVREHTGIQICKEQFGIHAVQMPDPTMLLKMEDYENLIHRERTWCPELDYIAAYVLDEQPTHASILSSCAQELQLHLQHLLPHTHAPRWRDRFAPGVSQWLRLIRDSRYVITDSYHGSVFAIIFNKPFVCLANAKRGKTRFESLLETFGLKNRLIDQFDMDSVYKILQIPIDWNHVNAIMKSERERGLHFLLSHLSE